MKGLDQASPFIGVVLDELALRFWVLDEVAERVQLGAEAGS